ncbi:MAG TPA: class A beta-lactamase [Stellaceae bacterium]|jgi:beta-lactamase class A|nr:class A beta-lactamase [Stellaceae bacterium]
MTIRRRTLLAAAPAALVVRAAGAADPVATLKTHEKAIGGRIGLCAENLKSGAKIAWRADERFAMCSTFKASLAACVLARIDRGEDALDRLVTYGDADILDYSPVAKANLAKGALSVAELCRAAVELSDNTCANLLLARVGGPAALTAFWRSTGDAVTRLDHNEPLLNRTQPPDPSDTTTPAAMAGNLRRFVLGDVLSPVSRALLAGWMRDCNTGTDMLRAGLPATWVVGDKTGNNGKDALGDIAVAWPEPDRPLVICAYTQGGTVDAARLHQLFADLGKLVAQHLPRQ